METDPARPAPPLSPLPDGLPAPLAEERLDARIVPYGILVNLITTAFLGALIAGGVWYLRRHVEGVGPWVVVAGWTAGALLLLTAFLQPILGYATWRYGMDSQLLVARYGILFREEKTIPVSRLQHVDLRRGPIERLFSLATLVVFTAGTEGATFRVPGLSFARARELRDAILASRGNDVV